MFTGLVQAMGRIDARRSRGEGLELVVSSPETAAELSMGASVSVSGVCLTAVEIVGDCFRVEVAPETIRRTWFGRIVEGDLVNLELPLRATDRLGGHFVQGHVDGVGRVTHAGPAFAQGYGGTRPPVAQGYGGTSPPVAEGSGGASPLGADHIIRIQHSKEASALVVEKGSIAIDGVSLTVTRCGDDFFEVMLIPHTLTVTTLGRLEASDEVHLEYDILAKYMVRISEAYRAYRDPNGRSEDSESR